MKHRDVSRGRAPAVREGTYVAGGTRDIDSRLDTERATCHRTHVHTNGARHRGAGPGARDGEQRHVGPPRLTRQICLRSAHDDPHRTPRQNGVVLVVATAHRSALQGASVPAIGGGTRSALAAADLCARSAGGASSGSGQSVRVGDCQLSAAPRQWSPAGRRGSTRVRGRIFEGLANPVPR
jgi:hypothetical protein